MMLSDLISFLSLTIAGFAAWQAWAARRESIPRPVCVRHGTERIQLYYPEGMAQRYGIEAITCPDGYELRRRDSLTIEQAASLAPGEVQRGTKLTYFPAASDITVAVDPSCRMVTVRCRLLSNPSFRIDHTLGI